MDSMTTGSLDMDNCSWPKIAWLGRGELCLWLFLMVVCNHSLLAGQMSGQYVFVPQLVMKGQWYRAVLSPFTHVSCYHLVLDGAAFLLLWHGLEGKAWRARWGYLAGCWAGSLAVPLALSAQVYERGLCGLSGIAHGLFAVTALEMLMHRDSKGSRTLGDLLFAGLMTKVLLEIVSGGGVMNYLHIGNVGVPIVTSHLGGLVGGCAVFGLLRLGRKSPGWV